jgi:hypothetical protein
MMTTTIGANFPHEHPSHWHLLFAQEPDKDLDFDEGLEEDELRESKPPSRRPLLWILLIVVAIGIGYWILNPNVSFMPESAPPDMAEMTRDQNRPQSLPNIPLPVFQENQRVTLSDATGTFLLMGDPFNTKPGPMVKPGDTLIILDGSYQPTGWVYQVQTQLGKTGWITAEKLEKVS